jgi:rhamnosyltransferase
MFACTQVRWWKARHTEMTAARVCAVVVTFQPPPAVAENLTQVRPQVEGLVVVDNGSTSASLEPLHAAMRGLKGTLLENGANLGIAAALNAGVRWAKSQGFDCVVLFDQDSTVTPGFIAGIQSAYTGHPTPEKIAIVMPRYMDKVHGTVRRSSHIAADGAPLEVMTSGSFIPVSIFDACGGFREDFFIDQVDHEFGFRVREHGFIVVVSNEAILFHAPGAPRAHSFFGLMKFSATHHNAMRRYYMTRNGIVMVRRYWNIHPVWSRSVAKALFVLPVQILLAETDKWRKVRNMFLGAVDACRDRLGSADVG